MYKIDLSGKCESMTNILDLIQSDGLTTKKVSGSEHHSPCPVCGGKDRFIIWPEKGETGRAWCRQCNLKVDGPGYLMTVHSMTFPEAAEAIGKTVRYPARKNRSRIPNRATVTTRATVPTVEPIAEPEATGLPAPAWSETAELFITWAAGNLQGNPERLERLHRERGITPATVERWRLGWNPKPLKRPGAAWGLDGELSFPAGIVIPNIIDGVPVSVKIRRESGEPKYHLVRGSKVLPYLLPGEVTGTLAVVEGEFDALLLWEVARDVCTPIAGGGCANHPGGVVMALIARASVLLDCLDNDEPGENAGVWWRDWFPLQYHRWKPSRKDPGEMHQKRENVRRWIFDGIRAALRVREIWPGKLDFYEAVDALGEPFPANMLADLSEEEIERAALMAEMRRL